MIPKANSNYMSGRILNLIFFRNKHWNDQKDKKEKKSGSGVRLSVFPPLVYTVGGLLIESTVIRLFTVLLQQVSFLILNYLFNMSLISQYANNKITWQFIIIFYSLTKIFALVLLNLTYRSFVQYCLKK